MLLRITLIVLVSLAGLVALVFAIGAALPRAHTASRTVKLRQPPQAVWDTIRDVSQFPVWRDGVKSIEIQPGAGRFRWREVGPHGPITFELEDASPPSRIVTRIADPDLPYGGSWTYMLTAAPDGTQVTITENGEVRNPLFRFMSKFIFGHTATIDQFLRSLGRRFGEDVTPTGA